MANFVVTTNYNSLPLYIGLWVNEAKISHLWIPLDFTWLAVQALRSYCKHVLNHLASGFCPSQIQLASAWQCKGIEWYLQAGASRCKRTLTFCQLQTLWWYVRGGRGLSSGHWVILSGRAAPWAFLSVSADDISPKAVLEASWIQLAPQIQFVCWTLCMVWMCHVFLLFVSIE